MSSKENTFTRTLEQRTRLDDKILSSCGTYIPNLSVDGITESIAEGTRYQLTAKCNLRNF